MSRTITLWIGLLCSALPVSLAQTTPAGPADSPIKEPTVGEIQTIDTVEALESTCGNVSSESSRFEDCRRKLSLYNSSYQWVDAGRLLKQGESLTIEHLDDLYGISGPGAEVTRRTIAAVLAAKCKKGRRAPLASFEELMGPECRQSLPTLPSLGMEIDSSWAGIEASSTSYEKPPATSEPTTFKFDAKFFSPEHSGKSLILPAGSILHPVVPGRLETKDADTTMGSEDSKNLYQPVTLCSELKLDFDNDGYSQYVQIDGFCLGPGLPIPPTGTVWTLSGVISQTMRYSSKKEKCAPDNIRVVRDEVTQRPEPGDPKVTCIKASLDECYPEFEEAVGRWFPGRRLDDLLTERVCTRLPPRAEKGRQVRELSCKVKEG